MRPTEIFKGPLNSVKRLKNLITFFVAAHVIFLVLGQWMVAKGFPGVLYLRAEQIKEIQNLVYLKPLTGVLADSLVLKIFYAFFFNLVFGAFVSTTLTGIIFFLPYVIAVWRSFLIGILVWGLDTTPSMMAVFYGTFILEFGAYCLSSAVGMDIGLSILWPRRKRAETRRQAFRIAVRQNMNLYVLIAIILFLGAIWEITWLHYMGPLIDFNNLK